ncbi:contractile injection system protein, VgrG/Pvc8 family [Azonexus sp. R2A61]|uniref:contractile injection system protein, VgrG/Pvc8 family n=1 Tax=Azonexus sp. R2A61 TaxID=2744443 RepID=UPI001F1D45B6|nr:contractile injection system protein, VgrG/Pvc8 family [Azonexus sp. R2A61]
MIDLGQYLARQPDRRIDWRIAVDGKQISQTIDGRQRLMSLTHTDLRGFEADTLDIEFDDSDGALALPAKGAEITFAFGWAGEGLVDKGKFIVADVQHRGTPDVLAIRATSADLAAGLTTQRERAWHQTTLGAIVRTIADENGLKPLVHASLENIAIAHDDQTNESSASFLTRLAKRYDAYAAVKNNYLIVSPSGAGITASGAELPTLDITRQRGDQHNFLFADRDTFAGVRALYNDVDLAVKGEVVWGDSEDSNERKQRPATVSTTPVNGQYKALPTTYPSRQKALRAARAEWKRLKGNKAARAAYIGVRAKYNDRNLSAAGEVAYGQADDDKAIASAKRQAATDASRMTGTANQFDRTADNLKTLRHVYSNRQNALRAARAEWRRLQRGVATFSLTLAVGIPEAIPEMPAIVRGWKPQIDGTDWLVTKATNTIGADGGYSQVLEFEVKATEIVTESAI